jgi:cytochrome c-type biogenesis protein CcmF
VLTLAVLGVRSVGALVAFALATFTTAAIGGEFVRGSRVHRTREGLGWGPALLRTLARNRRRYGGYVVHLGVVLIVVGFAGSAFSTERQALLRPGEEMDVSSYTLRYTDTETFETDEKQINTATIEAFRDGDHVATMKPQRNFHFAQQQPQSEVAIRTNPVEDLYVVAQSFDPEDDAVALVAFVNPLTWWIWAGAIVMLAGMLVLLTGRAAATAPSRERSPAAQPAVVTR